MNSAATHAPVRSRIRAAGDRGSEARAMAPCDQDRNQLDPFASGYVQSLARPGGRVTGVFLRQTELAEKQTELLVQAVPGMARLGVLMPFR